MYHAQSVEKSVIPSSFFYSIFFFFLFRWFWAGECDQFHLLLQLMSYLFHPHWCWSHFIQCICKGQCHNMHVIWSECFPCCVESKCILYLEAMILVYRKCPRRNQYIYIHDQSQQTVHSTCCCWWSMLALIHFENLGEEGILLHVGILELMLKVGKFFT